MIVRAATLDDLDGIAPLFDAYRQFYEQAPDAHLARSFLHDRLSKNESIVLVAVDETRTIVGFCQLYPTFCSVRAAPIFVLYDLFVSPDTRRRGVARLLLREAERTAISSGKVRLDLSTAKANEAAQAAYESLGWVRDEVFFVYSKAVET